MNDLFNILKGLGGLAATLTFLIVIYQFVLKYRTTNEFDKLFISKAEREKQNDFKFIMEALLIFFAFYLYPLLAISQFTTLSKSDANAMTGWITVFVTLSSVMFMPVVYYAGKKDIPEKKYTLIKIIGIVNALLSLLWYIPGLLVITTYKSWSLLSVILPLVLLYSIFLMKSVYKTRSTSLDKYIVTTINEDELSKINLIHSYVIDENRTVLYENSATSEETFYVCDFSSEVYLKYKKLDMPTDQVIEENVSLNVNTDQQSNENTKTETTARIDINVNINSK
ncbi:hypothetical protein COD78_10820 [Bacillus cereus]|uniref:hypothetical protein n=1 Tax=Bacillus cereus TaxID=1396 RepID=UPI000BED9EF2|nr:hypothetical protein [Bacillus cereus]PED31439.1 hypothetical protein CON13_17580 [Bacillus cereus]PEE53094.1 hypothetical protein COM80_07945 [Bacillus cereus]PER17515.1 hypothetical protein CN484_10290 [Bacillus cereus]PFD01747.1 hypothetical protein CN277_17300 [Bacillus cereus]PFL87313.1 hypothetical protein COJ35_29945 [Bacillus cereus]